MKPSRLQRISQTPVKNYQIPNRYEIISKSENDNIHISTSSPEHHHVITSALLNVKITIIFGLFPDSPKVEDCHRRNELVRPNLNTRERHKIVLVYIELIQSFYPTYLWDLKWLSTRDRNNKEKKADYLMTFVLPMTLTIRFCAVILSCTMQFSMNIIVWNTLMKNY